MFDFNKIIEKYNYNEAFGKFLYQIYIELINYYGNEEIIYNALLNTEIKFTADIYSGLKENGMLEEETEGIVSEGDFRRSSGVCSSMPIMVYENGEFKVTDVKRIVLVRDFNINDVRKKAVLIHELCHLVKGYENEYVVNGDTLIESSGLIRRESELSIQDGHVKIKLKCKKVIDETGVEKTVLSETGVGLEEGFTAMSEVFIARRILDENYESSGYQTVFSLSRKLTEYVDESLIRHIQMHHDKRALYEQIENYDEIERLADQIYKSLLDIYANPFTDENIYENKKKILEMMEQYKMLLGNENTQEKGRQR